MIINVMFNKITHLIAGNTFIAKETHCKFTTVAKPGSNSNEIVNFKDDRAF
jgi:hypothetical protein